MSQEKIDRVWYKIIKIFNDETLDLTEIAFLLKDIEYEYFYRKWYSADYEKLIDIDRENLRRRRKEDKQDLSFYKRMETLETKTKKVR